MIHEVYLLQASGHSTCPVYGRRPRDDVGARLCMSLDQGEGEEQAGAQMVRERGRQGCLVVDFFGGILGEISGVKSQMRPFRFFPKFAKALSFA